MDTLNPTLWLTDQEVQVELNRIAEQSKAKVSVKPADVVTRLRQRGIAGSVTPYADHFARLAPSLLTSPEEVNKTLAAVRQLTG